MGVVDITSVRGLAEVLIGATIDTVTRTRDDVGLTGPPRAPRAIP
jgi:hypothetical protein